MQNRTAYSGGDGPAQEELDSRLTVELATVVSAARRRATRDGDRQVDTAHLLHGLLESDPAVRAAFDGPPQVARLLGYLVQRSIGYGLQWHGTIEDSGAVPLVAEGGVPGWSPAAAAAMDGALDRAHAGYATRAGCLDLLAALVDDPESRAVEVLRRASVDTDRLAARLDGERPGGDWPEHPGRG
ncbi:peptidase [Streptomyces decoyicus]|uniref:Peptidase n=2 Tax=Streptomyces TaxID=1883 RepID=A0ABZ1FTD1_9ACTN|nr:Clp protease N-terminal domain-containing protein [Streptomyces decoyicus]WSB72743.1 peptidase [Streptomyces decoyicus]